MNTVLAVFIPKTKAVASSISQLLVASTVHSQCCTCYLLHHLTWCPVCTQCNMYYCVQDQSRTSCIVLVFPNHNMYACTQYTRFLCVGVVLPVKLHVCVQVHMYWGAKVDLSYSGLIKVIALYCRLHHPYLVQCFRRQC